MLNDDFMLIGYMPAGLPVSCLTTAPRFDTKPNQNLIARRGPLLEINKDGSGRGPMSGNSAGMSAFAPDSSPSLKKVVSYVSGDGGVPKDSYLADLHRQLAAVLRSNPAKKMPITEDEIEDPKCSPIFWVSKWVDYSDKYGFGYALCDESIGVIYNDVTKLLLLSDGR